MLHMADWETVKLPREMVQKLNEFVETKYAKNSGFTSKSQIIVFAVREFLRNYSQYQTYLDYLGFEKKVIKLMDHKLGKIIDIKFDNKLEILICKNHDSINCDHIRFLWTLPRFSEELKKFKKPPFIPEIKNYTKNDILEELQRPIKTCGYNKLKDKKVTKKKMIQILNEIVKDLEE